MKGTVGIWSPGEIIEVSTVLPEVVRIVRGRAARTVPGLLERAIYKKGDVFYLPANLPKVLFEALDNNDVAYECIFYQEELDDARESLMRLRFQLTTGELTDHTQIRSTRRKIARLMKIQIFVFEFFDPKLDRDP